jgi:NADPH:quinone reductase-like Zn-dependent oxidoreductase
MKAILHQAYGPYEEVLRFGDTPIPEPKDDEVLIRVRAASVHPDIWHVVTGSPHVLRIFGAGLLHPAHPIPGTDAAGVVEQVGSKVSRFRVGDEVYGETHAGLQWQNGGAFAEYVAAPESALVKKPPHLPFEEAATVPTSGIIALINLPAEELLSTGRHVLINGAGGGVGTIALQAVKALGGTVTAVDTGPKLDILRSLGADRVLDFRRQSALEDGVRYDVIFDVASTLLFSDCKAHLSDDGKYVLIGHDHFGRATGPFWGSLPRVLGLTARSLFETKLPKPGKIPQKEDSMNRLNQLITAGKLRPIVSRTFPLEEVVAALRFLETESPSGRIVLVP